MPGETERDRERQRHPDRDKKQGHSEMELFGDRGRQRDGATKILSERERVTNTQQGLREAGRPVSRETAVEAGLTQCTPHTHMHTHAETGLRWVDGQSDSWADGGRNSGAPGGFTSECPLTS